MNHASKTHQNDAEWFFGFRRENRAQPVSAAREMRCYGKLLITVAS